MECYSQLIDGYKVASSLTLVGRMIIGVVTEEITVVQIVNKNQPGISSPKRIFQEKEKIAILYVQTWWTMCMQREQEVRSPLLPRGRGS